MNSSTELVEITVEIKLHNIQIIANDFNGRKICVLTSL